MIDIFAKPLGSLLNIVYDFVSGIGLDTEYISAYAIALILTTIIFKLILLPLGIKQAKSMKKMQEIQPKVKEIQKKYKDDPQTQQAKTMELYKEHNTNPFASCLPILIQMPIIIGFFRVLRQAFPTINEKGEFIQGYVFPVAGDRLAGMLDKITNVLGEVKNASSGIIERLNEIVSNAGTITPEIIDQFNETISQVGEIPSEVITRLNEVATQFAPNIDTSFLWLDNLKDPDPYMWGLPLLAALTTFLQTRLMNAKKTTAADDKAQQSQKMMNMIFPVLIFVMSQQFPAGLALYWVVGNTFTIVQQYFTNKAMDNVKEASN